MLPNIFHPLEKSLVELMTFPRASIPESSGQTVRPSERSEIKEVVVLAGPSEQLLQCLTEFVFTAKERITHMSLQRISFPVAIPVGLGAMEDSPEPPGLSGREKAWSLEVPLSLIRVANPMPFNLVSTM